MKVEQSSCPVDRGCFTPLVVREAEKDEWRLVEDLYYNSSEGAFRVRAGFRTDFASVPRPFWWLIPRHGRYSKAAVLHDYLGREGILSRCENDRLFRVAMADLGVPLARRWIMWGAVSAYSFLKTGSTCGVLNALRMLGITIACLPVLLLAATIILGLVLFWLVETAIRLCEAKPPHRTVWWS